MRSARTSATAALLLVLAGCSAGNAGTPVGSGAGSASATGPATDASAVARMAAQPAPSDQASAAANPAGTCTIFPADNVWHADVSRLPVLANSATLVASIGASAAVHADFGAGTWDGGPIGIPVTTVPA